MRKENKFKNVALMLAVLLLVGCGTQTKGKETALETKQETVLETTLESKKETLKETTKESKETETSEDTTKETTTEKAVSKEETSKETKASEESKGSKKQEIDGTVRPKKSKTVDHKDSSNSTQSSSEKKPEPKKEEPVKKKSNEEIAKEVLNGSWGSGQDRKNRLESAGYNYSEVQAIVNKIAPAPVVQKRRSNSSTSSDSTSSRPARVQANNTIVINGYEFSISNVNTQARLDARYQELVNWGPDYVGYKTVGGGSIFLAVHVDSYGWLVQKANSITLKDVNGNVKTYHRAGTLGPVYGGKEMPDYSFNYLRGAEGDAIAIQTCVIGSNNSTSYVHIFR